jgi:hypothetical protein
MHANTIRKLFDLYRFVSLLFTLWLRYFSLNLRSLPAVSIKTIDFGRGEEVAKVNGETFEWDFSEGQDGISGEGSCQRLRLSVVYVREIFTVFKFWSLSFRGFHGCLHSSPITRCLVVFLWSLHADVYVDSGFFSSIFKSLSRSFKCHD